MRLDATVSAALSYAAVAAMALAQGCGGDDVVARDDAASPFDAGELVRTDAGADAGLGDAGVDGAVADAGDDAGAPTDAGSDAGRETCPTPGIAGTALSRRLLKLGGGEHDLYATSFWTSTVDPD